MYSYKQHIVSVARISSILAAFCMAGRAWADSSTSFQLYHESPNYAARESIQSDGFILNEDGVTWYEAPIVSTSYQIVTAPPVAAAVVPLSPAGEEEEDEGGGGGGSSGGHRGSGTIPGEELETEPTAPAAPEEPSVQPELKTTPFPDTEFRLPDMKPIPKGGVLYPRGEQLLGSLHYFYTVDPQAKPVKRIPMPYAFVPPEAYEFVQTAKKDQRTIMMAQVVSSLSFLAVIHILLIRMPAGVLTQTHLGRIYLIPTFFRRKKKEEKRKNKKKKSSPKKNTPKKKPVSRRSKK